MVAENIAVGNPPRRLRSHLSAVAAASPESAAIVN
jgi:hypothetical protein